jgi:hypothetical protein
MSLSSFKGFGVPHSYSRRKLNRVKRILQKDSGSDIGGSDSTQRGNGSNDESGTRDTDSRSEEGDRAVPLHLQNQRELRHVHDPNKHRAEWIQGSAIDPEVTRLNLTSLDGTAPYERLFYSDQIKRLNAGRLPGWVLKKYSHIEKGGWWASGVDPLTGEDELWGCFKPDHPRIDPTKGKYQKYEHPLKATATLFALRVPLHIWEMVSKRYGVPLPENLTADAMVKQRAFGLGLYPTLKYQSFLPRESRNRLRYCRKGMLRSACPESGEDTARTTGSPPYCLSWKFSLEALFSLQALDSSTLPSTKTRSGRLATPTGKRCGVQQSFCRIKAVKLPSLPGNPGLKAVTISLLPRGASALLSATRKRWHSRIGKLTGLGS